MGGQQSVPHRDVCLRSHRLNQWPESIEQPLLMVCIFEVASVTKWEAVSVVIPTESVVGKIAGAVLPLVKEESR